MTRFRPLVLLPVLCGAVGCARPSETEVQAPTSDAPAQTASVDPGSQRPFEITAPAGWTKREQDIGFELASPDGQAVLRVSGPFAVTELERHQEVLAQSMGELEWSSETIEGGELVSASVSEDLGNVEVAYLVTPEVHVMFTLQTRTAIRPEDLEALRAAVRSVKINRVRTQEELAMPECPPEHVEAARSQAGVCLEPAVLGETVVGECAKMFLAAGFVHDPKSQKLLEDRTGKTLKCFAKQR